MDARFLPLGPCFFCGLPGLSYICEGCQQDIFAVLNGRCTVCASPLPATRICGSCLAHPPWFDSTTVLTDYVYPFDRYLQTFKYHHRPELIRLPAVNLASLILQQRPELPQAIIPVPLHPARQRQRGYNQSAVMAKVLSKQLGIEVIEDVVVRCRNTANQSSLKHAERRGNVNRAFSVIKPIALNHIAICDDVVTTGATVNELAKVLKASGCVEVHVWALARTPG